MIKDERTERVTALRDKALAIVKARGEMKLFGGVGLPASRRALQFRGGGLWIIHHTPFEKLPGQPSSYGLDVWDRGVKVLWLLWNVDGGDIEVGSYKPGPWEQQLEAL